MIDKYEEDVVSEVRQDFDRRASERRTIEAQWQLNANFVMGNQYCYVNVKGEIEDSDKEYYWQEREVFNHIATILESRLAKLSAVRPKFVVQPASSDDVDVKTAKVCTKILESASNSLCIDEIISKATMWSELTGSVFYKVGWDNDRGRTVGKVKRKNVKEGDVRIDVCPPFEIYPDSLGCDSIEDCASIIHAKALHVDEIERIWGKKVKGETVKTLSYDGMSIVGGLGVSSFTKSVTSAKKTDYAVVIERYTKPTIDKPEGELVIVAQDQLLYYGPMPTLAGEYSYPFIRQVSIENAGCFYGVSMVERCIPVQRAYNAVKNRKHEFLNRIAMGVLSVEDGSVDTSDLEEEGLSPGKILVYRQGSTPPVFMSPGTVPDAFSIEENKLLSEFVEISGISELMRSSSIPSSVTSGTALQMIVEQDDTRISVTAQSIRTANRQIVEKILNLYKENAKYCRLSRFVGEEGDVELISWKNSDLTSNDVVFATTNELTNTVTYKRNTMIELLKLGLLSDENGKINQNVKRKILDAFGYGGWEQVRNVQSLHLAKAERENLDYQNAKVSEIDDHEVHIDTHVAYMLSSQENVEQYNALLEHVREHKKYAKITQSMEETNAK